MRRNPERLAWIILINAFLAFCLTATACPLAMRWYLLNARIEQKALVRSQRGTVSVQQGRKRLAISADDPLPTHVYKGNEINIGDLSEGLLTLQQVNRQEPQTMGTILIYPASTLQLVDVYSPRFGLATDTHTGVLRLKRGGMRVAVAGTIEGRATHIRVLLPQGEVKLTAGDYTLEIYDNKASVSVHQGNATLRNNDKIATSLSTDERAILSAGEWIAGSQLNERNLILDNGLSADWSILPDAEGVEPPGTVKQVKLDEQTVMHFVRDGSGPSQVGVQLPINQDVGNAHSLILHLDLQIKFQSLSVCGSLGSECPVMVRIDYKDTNGGDHQWVHGFYAYDDPNVTDLLHCYTCPLFTGNHSQIPAGDWTAYDSPNLMHIGPEGIQPAFISTVRIYASGHSYDSLVADVELLTQE